MRFIDFIIVFSCSMLLFISCSSVEFEDNIEINNSISTLNKSSSVATKQVLNLQDINYGEHPEQVYDIYLPEDRSMDITKVIVLIHGGGWRYGDKSSMSAFIEMIKNSNPNHAIVNMNYVLAKKDSYAFPNQFYDIELLLNELTSKSYEYQITPEFALIGRSAGAHLALMYDNNYDLQERVKMVCSIAGPTDFTNPFYQENPNFNLLFDQLVDHDAFPENTNLVKFLSPTYQISRFSSPTIIFHGNEDTIVPIQNSIKLRNELNNKNIPNHLSLFDDEGHGNWSEKTMKVVEDKLNKFIHHYFSIF